MRTVTQNDFDTIYDIYMDETVYPVMQYELGDKEEFPTIFEQLCNRDEFWIFDDEGHDCGMCTITKHKGRLSHIAGNGAVGVKKEQQRKSIGKKMMRKVIEQLTTEGFKRIELIVLEDNEPAKKFYENLNFEINGVIPNFFKRSDEDSYLNGILMSLKFLTN